MTRGTFYLLLPHTVIESCEFNGGMYEGEKMKDAIEKLRQVTDEQSFINKITEFDKDHFGYQEKSGDYFQFRKLDYDHYGRKPVSFNSEMVDIHLDMYEDYFGIYFSDYLYFLNLSGKTINVLDESGNYDKIENDQLAIYNFGKRYYPKSIKL